MTVSFSTLGCKVNQYESEAISEIFKALGYEVLPPETPADVMVVNSCTVTAESNRKTRQTVRRLRRLSPDAVIVLTGCMVQAFPEESALIKEADIVVGNTESDKIPSLVECFFKDKNRILSVVPHEKNEKILNLNVSKFSEHTRSYIKIEDGCNRFCSYCIIPYARGRVRSRSLESITAEAKRLAKAGYKETVLVGINLSAYGTDTGDSLCEAVLSVAKVEGIKRVRLGSLECDQISDDDLIRLSECEKFCPQFHLSLQSGADNTLKAMNRKYDTEFYRDLVNRIRKTFKSPSITTDIMVGFAGETDEDFRASCNFVKEIGFARSHVFVYSEREGTIAAKNPLKVDMGIRQHRSKIMADICKLAEKEFLQSQIGTVQSVLFETVSDNVWEGYTENYTKVKVKCNEHLEGKILPVKITAAGRDCCDGELV